MKLIKNTAILITCIAMLSGTAYAQDTLSAKAQNGILEIKWDVDCTGGAVMTVYRDGWPFEVRNVRCEDDGARVSLPHPNGRYTVRLRTDTGCLTAEAGMTGVPATQKPVVTMKPVETDAPVNTQKPAPTAVITPRPTVAFTPVPTFNAPSGSAQTELAAQVVRQVNDERAKLGLSPLKVSAELTRAACVRAAEIVEKFSHTRPDGSKWSTVSGSAYGENIAKGQSTADKVMAAWMSSDGHRANILRGSFGSIGVCAYVSGGITYWVQLFGK